MMAPDSQSVETAVGTAPSATDYRHLFESAREGIIILDASTWCIADANRSVGDFIDIPHGEMIGKRVDEIHPLKDFFARTDLFERLRKDGNAHCAVAPLKSESGGHVEVEVTGSAYQVGERLRIQCVFRDITAFKRRAEALLEREDQVRLFVEHSPAAIAMLDRDMKYLLASRRWMKEYGLGVQDIIGRSHYELFPEIPQRWKEIHKRCLAGATEKCDEEAFLRADGTIHLLRWEIRPWQQADGKIGGIMIFSEDVKKRKEMEESHARLARAVEQCAETIVITDTQGRILYVNPAFEKITGYSREEALGQNPRVLKSGKHDADFYRRMWETLGRGETWSGRMVNRRKDGTHFEEEATISPVFDAAGTTVNYVAVKRDVTREAQLEAQYRQAQKIESIGQLAGGIAHDFNNILSVILMQVELSNGEYTPSMVDEGLNEIKTAAQRAANLTRQLLLFSRQQVMQLGPCDLNEVVTSLAKMLRVVIREDVSLELDLCPTPLKTVADRGMLEQLLMNLAVNARDAMPKGGKLAIRTAERHITPEEKESYPEAAVGTYVWLSVRDTGCGIAPEIQSRMFEPFFTTKEVGKGTGLGLATVSGIVQQHRGFMRVSSEVGKGAEFQVFLPADKNSGKGSLAQEAGEADKRGGSETVLLAEDDDKVRMLTRMVLDRNGYRVLDAADGVTAQKVWNAHREQISLLVTDLVMPGGMDGRELAMRLQHEEPGLKVLFTSGYSPEMAGRALKLQPGQSYLQKPYTPHQLLKAIQKVMDS